MGDEVEEIKLKTDIVELIGQYLPLKKTGANWKGLCPFHSEKTPSFMVNAERQIFRCFGCGESGDIYEFIMKMENLNFREALEMLAQRSGVALRSHSKYETRNSTCPPSGRREFETNPNFPNDQNNQFSNTKSQIYKINLASAKIFHKILYSKTGESALKYLKSRGLTDETIKTFQIGFAPQKPILSNYFVSKNISQDLLYKTGNPQKFFNRIMFPICDVLGNVLGFTGRALDNETQPKYYNTPETEVFKKSRILYGLMQAKNAIRETKIIILAEGQMDVVSAHQSGVKNIIASSGTAFTDDHLRIILRYTDNIVLAFDADEAGKKAALTVIQMALEKEMNIKVVVLPENVKDIGEVAVANPTLLKNIIQDAVYWLDWIINSKIDNGKSKIDIADKKLFLKQIALYLKWVKNPIEKSHWINYLSQKFGVSQESINALIDSNSKQTKLASLEIVYGMLEIFPALKSQHSLLYNRLNDSYNSQRDMIVMEVKNNYADLNEEIAQKEIEDILKRRKIDDLEKIKSDFARRISEAEQNNDREKVKELMLELHKKII
ncbi:MAG: DNA primase [Candidatus Berkelbacteria bacterium Licking1014_85]|uniref:DNA primase n=1 Tax=Candidatus Berkelbacteria bacterium Licking1014_85 TaxID=2017148 RepID=A0A554LHN6_9BACT|nr:MAG: DNA primase [Candidatus Berkelbacteria bacterium Licking1014_85]